MDIEFKNLLIGLTLGDGCIPNDKPSAIRINHSYKQKDFIIHKAKLINEYTDKHIKIIEFNSNGEYKNIRFVYINKYLKRVRNWLYKDGKKYITKEILHRLSDREIAIWYMDDGSLYKKKTNNSFELVFSTYCDTEEEVIGIIEFFKERYDADFTIKRNKGKFSLRCGKKSAEKLLKKLDAYIIDSMSYKTFNKYPNT